MEGKIKITINDGSNQYSSLLDSKMFYLNLANYFGEIKLIYEKLEDEDDFMYNLLINRYDNFLHITGFRLQSLFGIKDIYMVLDSLEYQDFEITSPSEDEHEMGISLNIKINNMVFDGMVAEFAKKEVEITKPQEGNEIVEEGVMIEDKEYRDLTDDEYSMVNMCDAQDGWDSTRIENLESDDEIDETLDIANDMERDMRNDYTIKAIDLEIGTYILGVSLTKSVDSEDEVFIEKHTSKYFISDGKCVEVKESDILSSDKPRNMLYNNKGEAKLSN